MQAQCKFKYPSQSFVKFLLFDVKISISNKTDKSNVCRVLVINCNRMFNLATGKKMKDCSHQIARVDFVCLFQ